MNYYPFNINDYYGATRHLSLLEDLAYRRMLDLYFEKEAPLPGNVVKLARLLCMSDHSDAVTAVLDEYFDLVDGVWHNVRCDEELRRWYDKVASAKESAAASVAARERKRAAREAGVGETQKPGETDAGRTDSEGSNEPELGVTPGGADVGAGGERSFSGGATDPRPKTQDPDKPIGLKILLKNGPPGDLVRGEAMDFVLSKINEVQPVKFRKAQHLNDRFLRAANVEELKAMAEGAVLILRYKAEEWGGSVFARYLVPQTLWSPKKWDDFLAVAEHWDASGRPAIGAAASGSASVSDAAKRLLGAGS